ncbi:hypothetical protein ACJX0J_015993, partial [Zea mays]
ASLTLKGSARKSSRTCQTRTRGSWTSQLLYMHTANYLASFKIVMICSNELEASIHCNLCGTRVLFEKANEILMEERNVQ